MPIETVKNKRICRPVMYSSTSSDASSISSSNSSSSSSGSNNSTDSSTVSRSHSGSDSSRGSRPETSSHQKNERPQRRSMITENQPDDSHDSTTTAHNRHDKCTTKRCDNSDNATTMQDRTMKNKCVIGDSDMRGLATQLKAKLTNPESVCVYKTSGMKIAHLTTRLPGYVNEDTEAVIIHLGTNDIGDQANKAMQDISLLNK